MAPQEAHDEFEEQAQATEATSGYESTRDADVEDQREFRLVPAKTDCTLRVTRFSLDTKKAPCIFARTEIVAPVGYADGASNFSKRMSLNAAVGEGKKGSGWDMTRRELVYMYAAINQCDSATASKELLGPVYEQFAHIGPDDQQAFRETLVARLNDAMADATFDVVIGIERDKDGKYPDKQTWGVFKYPKAEKK